MIVTIQIIKVMLENKNNTKAWLKLIKKKVINFKYWANKETYNNKIKVKISIKMKILMMTTKH